MATTTTKPNLDVAPQFKAREEEMGAAGWPRGPSSPAAESGPSNDPAQKPSGRDALQALLAFSALHEQVRRRRALASPRNRFDSVAPAGEFEPGEQFVLDEVLQVVAEHAVAITRADGLAIALAENNEIVLRASAGTVKPDVGARIDRDSAFSGACFRMAQIVRSDDTETDDRVNLQACRRLGARSMVAVPLCGRRRVIGVLEAFSAEPFGFNDSDVRSLSLLAELILGALRPEDEDRFAESATVAESGLTPVAHAEVAPKAAAPAPVEKASPLFAPPVAAPVAPPVTPRVESVTPSLSIKTKPVEAEIASAASAPVPVLRESLAPVFASRTILDLEQAAEPEAAEELSHHRPGVLLVLLLVVFASVLAGGLWWKLKNAQLGNVMVQPQKPALQPVSDGTVTESPAAEPSGTVNPDAAATITPEADTLSAPAEPSNTAPASPQELSKFPHVSGIRHWSSADSSTVVLDVEDQVQYEAHRLTGPDRIYFDLRDTVLAPELMSKTLDVGDALLNRIRVAQPVAGMTRVVLETKGSSNFSVSLEPNPYRLVVQVRKIGATPKTAVNLFPNEVEAANRLAIVVPPPTREDMQLRAHITKMRIVVDAGHGGWDLGTVGRRGLLEKDVVLEIAQRLGKLLQSRLGADVVYTRQDDNYIPLDERAGIANQAQADLFVSVHANYSDLPSARGVETYYTNFFSSPNAKDFETRANNATGSKDAVTASLSPAQLHERIEQSRRLAASVQRSLYGTLSGQNPGLRDRGIKEAGFVVLTETSMPGILAEVSFVSSPTDEQKLRSDGYREQIAEALYKGIARYAANSRSVKVASAAKQ